MFFIKKILSLALYEIEFFGVKTQKSFTNLP
jgi:hypothetical protein